MAFNVLLSLLLLKTLYGTARLPTTRVFCVAALWNQAFCLVWVMSKLLIPSPFRDDAAALTNLDDRLGRCVTSSLHVLLFIASRLVTGAVFPNTGYCDWLNAFSTWRLHLPAVWSTPPAIACLRLLLLRSLIPFTYVGEHAVGGHSIISSRCLSAGRCRLFNV